jgi:hypothetical protein
MATYLRGKFWWYRFRFAGERINEPTKSTSRTVAKDAERQHRRTLEAGYNNFKEVRQNRVRILEEMIDEYLTGYCLRYRSASFTCQTNGRYDRGGNDQRQLHSRLLLHLLRPSLPLPRNRSLHFTHQCTTDRTGAVSGSFCTS